MENKKFFFVFACLFSIHIMRFEYEGFATVEEKTRKEIDN